MSQKLIQFKVSDDDYNSIAGLDSGKSANLIAKQIVLDALIREKETADQTLIMAIRSLTFLQRYAQATLPPEKLGEVFTQAQEDEKEIAKKVGAAGYEQ